MSKSGSFVARVKHISSSLAAERKLAHDARTLSTLNSAHNMSVGLSGSIGAGISRLPLTMHSVNMTEIMRPESKAENDVNASDTLDNAISDAEFQLEFCSRQIRAPNVPYGIYYNPNIDECKRYLDRGLAIRPSAIYAAAASGDVRWLMWARSMPALDENYYKQEGRSLLVTRYDTPDHLRRYDGVRWRSFLPYISYVHDMKTIDELMRLSFQTHSVKSEMDTFIMWCFVNKNVNALTWCLKHGVRSDFLRRCAWWFHMGQSCSQDEIKTWYLSNKKRNKETNPDWINPYAAGVLETVLNMSPEEYLVYVKLIRQLQTPFILPAHQSRSDTLSSSSTRSRL